MNVFKVVIVVYSLTLVTETDCSLLSVSIPTYFDSPAESKFLSKGRHSILLGVGRSRKGGGALVGGKYYRFFHFPHNH